MRVSVHRGERGGSLKKRRNRQISMHQLFGWFRIYFSSIYLVFCDRIDDLVGVIQSGYNIGGGVCDPKINVVSPPKLIYIYYIEMRSIICPPVCVYPHPKPKRVTLRHARRANIHATRPVDKGIMVYLSTPFGKMYQYLSY